MPLDDLEELRELLEKYLKRYDSEHASVLKAELEARIADGVKAQIL